MNRSAPLRSALLNGYLVLVILANAATTGLYLSAGKESVMKSVPGLTGSLFYVLVVCGTLNVVAACAILLRRKWGFWLFAATAAGLFLAKVTQGMASPSALLGPAVVLLLYALLRSGGPDAAWPRLK